MKKWRIITILLAVAYASILLKLIVFKYPVDFTFTTSFFALNSNFIPFKTILGYLSGEPSWHISIHNLAGNILLFVPFGIFLPLIFRTLQWKKMLITSLVFSVLLETLQVFLPGSIDVDDVLLNSLGAMIGFVIYFYGSQKLKKSICT